MSPEDMFNYATGVLAILSVAASLITYFSRYLPGSQMKVLKVQFEEAKIMQRKAEEEGLLPAEGPETANIQEMLIRLDHRMCALDATINSKITLAEEVIAMCRGLTHDINRGMTEVKRIKSAITSTSEEQRRRLQQMNMESELVHTCIMNRDSGTPISGIHAPPAVYTTVSRLSSIPSSTINPHSVHELRVANICNTFSLTWKSISLAIPLTKLKWRFEYRLTKESDSSKVLATQASEPSLDILSLPV